MRRTTSLLALGSAVLGAAMLIASPLAVEAHETRTIVDGQYEIVVGFMNEPVYAGDKSGLEFWVTEPAAATPAARRRPACAVRTPQTGSAVSVPEPEEPPLSFGQSRRSRWSGRSCRSC